MALGELKNGIGPDAYAIYQQVLAAVVERDHPVGSLYISENATSPAELYGGTWEQIKDRFILAAGDTYAAGSTGGEAAHKLAREEMPRHEHFYRVDGKTGSPQVTFPEWSWGMSKDIILQSSEKVTSVGAAATPDGEGRPHNNMPPYTTKYVWQRIE